MAYENRTTKYCNECSEGLNLSRHDYVDVKAGRFCRACQIKHKIMPSIVKKAMIKAKIPESEWFKEENLEREEE